MHLYKNAPRHGALTICKLGKFSKMQFDLLQEATNGLVLRTIFKTSPKGKVPTCTYYASPLRTTLALCLPCVILPVVGFLRLINKNGSIDDPEF
jgi:hypothetical protein